MTPLRRLLTYFARHKKSLTLGGLCVVGSAIFSLLKPAIVGDSLYQRLCRNRVRRPQEDR